MSTADPLWFDGGHGHVYYRQLASEFVETKHTRMTAAIVDAYCYKALWCRTDYVQDTSPFWEFC